MKRPRPTLHDRVHETGSTDVLRTQVASVSVSPTLAESSFDYARSLLKVKTTHLTKNRCGFDA